MASGGMMVVDQGLNGPEPKDFIGQLAAQAHPIFSRERHANGHQKLLGGLLYE